MFDKHRLFVLTDIENEPDDTQSLIRLLLYSNEIDIEGLVACTSTWIRHDVRPGSIHDVLDGYEAVRPNLLRAGDFPKTDALRALVGEGPKAFGMEGVGEGHDSSGSEMLIAAVDRQDERRLHVALWGGANVAAQALWKVRATRTADELAKFASRMTIYAISDQDDAGPWIRRHFPLVTWIGSVHGENQYGCAAWLAFAANDFNGLPGATPELITNAWLKQHIQIGPLGSKYPDIMFAMEGDTPSFLGKIPNGLNDPDQPDWGGWGGRYRRVLDPEANHYHDAVDKAVAYDGTVVQGPQASVWRWRDAVQYDFAARMQWTLPEAAVELPPVVRVNGEDGIQPVDVRTRVNETVEIDASASTGSGKLSFKWFQYKEIGSYGSGREVPTLETHGTETSAKLRVTMPEKTGHQTGIWRRANDDGKVYMFILAVTSEGKFPLTRYRRVLVDCRAK